MRNSFAALNHHTASDAPDLAMVREHVNASVASTEKRAQQPTNNRNDDRAEKGAPETGNFKARHDLTNEFQHQRINN